MESYFLIIGAAIIGIFSKFFYDGFKKTKIEDPQELETAKILTEISEKLDYKETIKEPSAADSGLLERVEELERRMERLHKDSLRYLQSAAQRERHARDMLEAAGEDPEQIDIPDTVPMIQEQVPSEATNDLEWGKQFMKERGETAII
jgi:hypothetical protein